MLGKLVFFSLIFFASNNVNAWHACTGKGYVTIIGDGSVMIRSDIGFGDATGRMICSLTSAWNGIETSTCKGFLSSAYLAQATQKNIAIMYLDDSISCNAPAEGYPAPYAIWVE